jgi:hypothetical protein
MDPRLKRRVAVGVTGLAVATGGGIAYAAATQTSSPEQERKAFLDDAAGRLNTTPGKLEAALKAAAKARVDAAVADGRLTQDQADDIKQHIDQGGGVPFLGRGGPGLHKGFGPGGPGPGKGFGHVGPGPGHGGPFGTLDAVASYLGLTEAKLFEQLRSGKTLAEVAKAQGKSVDGLKAAISADVKKHLDEEVQEKDLTQAQADKLHKELDSHLDDLVNGKRPAPPAGRPRLERHGPWF